MKPRTSFSFSPLILITGIIALLTSSAAWAQTNSYARVVRLSFIEGEVTVQRPDVQAWAEAPVNTPLQEGFKLSTGDGSFAEIQFENGGTIRLGEHSLLDLTQLERSADGGTINKVNLRQGYATFHALSSRVEEPIEVGTPYGTIIALGGTEVRVDLDKGAQRVEVFEGTAEVRGSLGNLTIEKGSVLLLQPGTSEPTLVSQGITKDDWDNWVDDREGHSQVPANAPSPNSYADDDGGATYGWNDLLQYGTWYNVPGWGYGWTPATVSSGWAPYSLGQWCWYPGWGYTWIGTEPWGWLPYHYGGWDFVPGTGWVWFPVSLRSWSPGRVTWYNGSNWVGWAPRHIKDTGSACGNNCGGGVVSTSTFRNGGLLTSNVMLGFSPTTGDRVKEPGIPPTTAAKLTGLAVSYGAGTPANSTIVYDPRHNSYVNSGRVVTPPSPPTWPSAVNSTTPPANPAPVQPVPVEGRERPVGNQPYGSAYSAAPRDATPYASPANHGNPAKPAPATSYGNSSFGHTSEGSGGGSHMGGGSVGASHAGGGQPSGGGGGHH
jgi:hypothetical protein